MALVIGCNNSESIPAAYRGADGTYYGSEPANLTVVISNHGQNWRATGTLPWGESANFSGIIDENGNMINNATGFKSGKVTVYGDYVSSVYLMNYRVWRKGEEAWREKKNAKKQAIRDDNVSRLFKGIGKCREYAHEFQRDDESYLSLLKISDDGIIDNYVFDSKTGRIVGLSTITVSDDKNELYRSDEIGIYDSPVFFKFSVSKNGLRFKDNGWIADYKPARQEQIQLLSPILSPELVPVLGRWSKDAGNNSSEDDIILKSDFTFTIERRSHADTLSGKWFATPDNDGSSNYTLFFKSNNDTPFVLNYILKEKRLKDKWDYSYYSYPEWIDGYWYSYDYDCAFTIKDHILNDAERPLPIRNKLIRYRDKNWSVRVSGDNLLVAKNWADTYGDYPAEFYIDREIGMLGLMDYRWHVIKWFMQDEGSGDDPDM